MDVDWSLLDAQRVFGLVFVMTLDVSYQYPSRVYLFTKWFSAMRRVLHLKMVTQCAMLEDFGIFLVLADKVGFYGHTNTLLRSHNL